MLTKNASEKIGINVKRWREFKEVKQEELARKLNITAAALSHIETGKTDITISRIEQIAEILQIDFSLLLSSPQQVMDSTSNASTYASLHTTINQELVVALKTELQYKNEQIIFLQSLLRLK
jgi:transcriptional regulator with XRE-family HTH domain